MCSSDLAKVNLKTEVNADQATMVVSLNNSDAAKASLYYDKDILGVKIGESNTYLTVNLKTLGKDFNESSLRQNLRLGEISEDISIDLDQLDTKLLTKETTEALKDLLATYSKNIIITYEGTTTLEGQKGKLFQLVLEEDELKDFILDCYDIILSDEAIEEMMTSALMLDRYDTRQEVREELNRSKKLLQEELKNYRISDGLQMAMVVNNQKEIISCTSEMSIKEKNYGEQVQIGMTINLLGKQSLLDYVTLNAQIGDKTDTYALDVTYEATETSKEANKKWSIKAKGNKEVLLNASLESLYAPKEKEDNYSFTAKFSVPDEVEIKLNAEGMIEENKKEKTYQADLNNVTFSMSSPYGYSDAKVKGFDSVCLG